MMAWLSKSTLPLIVIAGLLLGLGGLAFAGLRLVNDMVETARTTAITERNAFWSGQIDKANAIVAQTEAANARETLRIESEATSRVRDAELQLAELEKQNAALPNGDACGLGRERVRLLPN